jgi:hypothetical protein
MKEPLKGTRLTNDQARRISKLISRLPELVERERDRNKARSRRKPQPLRSSRDDRRPDPRRRGNKARWLTPEIRVKAQHLKAKGMLRHAMMKALIEP